MFYFVMFTPKKDREGTMNFLGRLSIKYNKNLLKANIFTGVECRFTPKYLS